MSTVLSYLALLLPVAAVAWIVWSYQRKALDKEARSRERAAALLGVPGAAGPGRPGAGSPTPRAAPVPLPQTSPLPAPQPSSRPASRERFLSQPEALAYYLLRAGLPGYAVFPHVSLGAVLADGAVGGDSRPPLVRHDLDFVVCDKGLRVLAVVRLKPAGMAGAARWADERLAAAGIRVVTLDPAGLPRRAQVAALVLGAGA